MVNKKKKDRIVKRVTTMMNVRSNPSFDSLVVKILPEGAVFEVDPNFDNPDWDHIPEGYLCKKYLEEMPSDTIVERTPIVVTTKGENK